MHHIDRRTRWEEIWEAFRVLVYQGKIGYVGSSNFAGWNLALAQAAAKECNCLGLVSEQHKYNLLCRPPELEVLPAAQHLGIGVIAYSTLQGGMLGGKALNPDPKSRSEGARGAAEEQRAKLTAFSKLCRELGEDEANVAMAWVLAHPALNCVILGPRTAAQLKGALRAAEIKLDGTVMAKLNEIFPGPGGETPWAYAW
jgi:aryl-alcohol dehydrogenase-like predicted oxidoreductase